MGRRGKAYELGVKGRVQVCLVGTSRLISGVIWYRLVFIQVHTAPDAVPDAVSDGLSLIIILTPRSWRTSVKSK